MKFIKCILEQSFLKSMYNFFIIAFSMHLLKTFIFKCQLLLSLSVVGQFLFWANQFTNRLINRLNKTHLATAVINPTLLPGSAWRKNQPLAKTFYIRLIVDLRLKLPPELSSLHSQKQPFCTGEKCLNDTTNNQKTKTYIVVF